MKTVCGVLCILLFLFVLSYEVDPKNRTAS